MKPGVAARAHAAAIVARVTDDGAGSNVVLARDLAVPPETRSTIHALVMDTLRWLPWTDQVLAAASRRPVDALDRGVRAALRVGVTELLRGGEPHGVVDSTVEAVRAASGHRATGFVNGVLRAVARSRPAPPDRAAALGAPDWIRQRLVDQWSEAEADAFLAASLLPAPLTVRARPGRPPPPGEPVVGIDGAWIVASRGEAVGRWVMDASSTAVALAVSAAPGEAVLDAAAAPGNKTLALWDAMDGGRGTLVAADRSERRLGAARRRLGEAGAHPTWVVADLTAPPFPPACFDRVLLDAPCTGLGTVRRRPEIKSRIDPGSPRRMAGLQRRLLGSARRLLRPGGRLVYSVCTVFAEETVDLAAAFGGRPPDGLPGRRWGSGLLLAPHLTGTDGMFVTVIDA